VLNRLAPLPHLFRMFVEPALHCLENVLMLPSRDPSLLAGSTALLDGAALTGIDQKPPMRPKFAATALPPKATAVFADRCGS